MTMYQVKVLQKGYSKRNSDGSMSANGTCTLITGQGLYIIVDTLSPWDRTVLIELLRQAGLQCDDITHVICTHGHPDHIGNNNLFTSATLHIAGHSIYKQHQYFEHDFTGGRAFQIDKHDLYIIPTPGHTLDSISVVVNTEMGSICIAGDLFENENDVDDPNIWKEAGSENETLQMKHRNKVILLSDFIIPGHGQIFSVTENMKVKAKN